MIRILILFAENNAVESVNYFANRKLNRNCLVAREMYYLLRVDSILLCSKFVFLRTNLLSEILQRNRL